MSHSRNCLGATICTLLLLPLLLACDSGGVAPTATPNPGLKGRIAFSKQAAVNTTSDLFLINADGTGEVQVTAGAKVQGEFAWSQKGDRIAFSGLNAAGKLQINVVSLLPGQQPQTINLSQAEVDETFPSWSPDGSQLTFASKRGGSYQVYTMQADGSGARQISSGYAYAGWPSWSPDGSQLAFVAGETSAGGELLKAELYTMRPDGSAAKKLTSYNTILLRPRWSPDSQRLTFIYRQADATRTPKLYLTNADGSGQRAITEGTARDNNPLWSSDSQQLVYYSNANGSGRDNIFLAAAASPHNRQLTLDSGLYPSFSPDASSIIFSRRVAEQTQLFVMNADGSNQRQLTFSAGSHDFPAWIR